MTNSPQTIEEHNKNIKLLVDNRHIIDSAAFVLYSEGLGRDKEKKSVLARAKVILLSQFFFGQELTDILAPYVVWSLYKLEYLSKQMSSYTDLPFDV
jgi:hypothetical protein